MSDYSHSKYKNDTDHIYRYNDLGSPDQVIEQWLCSPKVISPAN
jgi:hypothetical protein